MPTLAIERTHNGVPQSAEVATIQVHDAQNVMVVPITVVPPTSPGMYSYEADHLTPGNYTVTWTFAISGYPPDIVTRLFTLDATVAVPEGVTLFQIERRVARRIGPYATLTATTGSTVNRLAARKIQSSMSLGNYEDQFMLRRGVNAQMAWIPSFNPDDRSRLVAEYVPADGYLLPDRVWARSPDMDYGEQVEIMYLDPDLELRPAVQDALRRCFFWDTLEITPSEGQASHAVNLSRAAPWITLAGQVRAVGTASSWGLPLPVRGWQTGRSGGSIMLVVPGGMPTGLTLDVLRPAYSLVNDELSLTGPNDDQDILRIDLDYAVWAGVVELWKNIPERLQPLVHESLRTKREEAAAEFTKKSLMVAGAMPDTVRWPSGELAYEQIGNLPEARV